jgi:hypothetical protein
MGHFETLGFSKKSCWTIFVQDYGQWIKFIAIFIFGDRVLFDHVVMELINMYRWPCELKECNVSFWKFKPTK